MFFEFIATVCAAFAAAGVALLLGKLSGGRTPSWLMPIAAGAAMLGYTIWSEYTWFDRTSASIPDGLVVVSQNDGRAFYRPWTYVFPLTDRFAALDAATVQTNDAIPDQRLANLYFWGRWAPLRQMTVVFDCAQGLSAPVVEGVTMDADGRIENADWSASPTSSRALEAACGAV